MEDRVFNLQLTIEEVLVIQELMADRSDCLEIPGWKGEIYDGLRRKAFNAYSKPCMSLMEQKIEYDSLLDKYKDLGCSGAALLGFVGEIMDRIRFYRYFAREHSHGIPDQEGGGHETEE